MRPDDQIDSTRQDQGSRAPRLAGADSATDPEVRSLQVNIEQTRASMTETVNAIERKLRPELLTEQAKEITDHALHEATEAARKTIGEATDRAKETAKEITDHAIGEAKEAAQTLASQAKASVRAATIGKVENMAQQTGHMMSGAQSSIIDAVKQNPIAAALAGIGLGWLLMSRGNNSPTQMASPTTRYYPPRQRGAFSGYSTGTWGGEARQDTEGTLHGAIDQAQETAGEVVEQVQQVTSSARNTAGDLGSGVIEVIRQNPIPSALAGLSIGYLLLNGSGVTQSPPVDRARGEAERTASQARQTAGRVVDEVQNTADDVVDRVQSTAEGVADRVQNTAEDVADRVQTTTDRLTGQAQRKAGQLGNDLDYQTLHTKLRLQELLNGNPLAFGAAAFLLGAAIGLPAPQTPQESSLMGSASNQVIDRAQSVAQDALRKAQHVAEEVTETVEREVKKEEVAS